MTSLATLGADVDRRARAAGLTVTTGGEPTFTVALTTAPEWRADALGEDKRARAEKLARALARRLGARVDDVPGRKYAGEDAPRWCLRIARPEKKLVATVIPDPGVVELNLPPARTARQLGTFLRSAYEAAGEAGLSAVRVLHNGRILGSGGGAHVTLGGPTVGKSPFVTRPALLADLVAYFHNHPGLSYAFVGSSAGPTSQAPRADEGGVDRQRDLGIALATLRARGGAKSVRDVQATLGPLLTDCTGNTHRAELNVEKLATLGLLELRAVEAQPTAEHWLSAALLFKAIVVRLATRRYREDVVPWVHRLHEKWSLPSHMRADLGRVLADVGLPRDLADPCLDHRYPVLGVLEARGVRCTVRQALEFWPVVGPLAGQESAASRAIDSSIERIELSLSGSRAVRLTAAGRSVPLLTEGRLRLGAVRFRAGWPAPGALHPLVGPHAPLEIVMIDHATLEPIAAARLHPWRPGGGIYDALPRDLDEAAERARARFEVVAPSGRFRRLDDPPERQVIDLLEPS